MGKTFAKRGTGERFKVVASRNLEDIVHQETMWQTLQVTPINLGRARRGRDDQEATEPMSIWELELVPGWRQEALEPAVVQAAINAMQESIEKRHDIALPFMERVPDAVAKDYRQHIPGEMWLQLI